MSTRKALAVGIDHYDHVGSLSGCVTDAHAVNAVLVHNSDGTRNFDVKLVTATGPADGVTRGDLRENIKELFADDCEIALLYFAGHGHIESTGGYLIASDSAVGDQGLPLSDVMVFANNSPARNRVIVLDSCHSGVAGSLASAPSSAELKEGTTIIAASAAHQYAVGDATGGVFTLLFVDALNGAAGNLVGDVTPGSVYAHIDQSLGAWDQRPIFKTNVKAFVSLRKVQPPIALDDLLKIADLFPDPGYEFPLDPSFEPEREASQIQTGLPPDPLNVAKFATLQKYNRVGLLVPVDAPHMWHAAMGGKSCRLTVLGEHYHRLVKSNRIYR